MAQVRENFREMLGAFGVSLTFLAKRLGVDYFAYARPRLWHAGVATDQEIAVMATVLGCSEDRVRGALAETRIRPGRPSGGKDSGKTSELRSGHTRNGALAPHGAAGRRDARAGA